MKPQYELAKALVETECVVWRHDLALGHITFRDRFYEGLKDDDEDVVADTETDWEYRQSLMRWFLPKLCTMTPEEIRHDVLHEHVHALTASIESELSTRHNKACEYAVESLTRAILHLADLRKP